MMGVFYAALALCCVVLASVYGWKFLNWAWLRPKRMEKQLRQQGFNGKSYTFLIGDYKEMIATARELRSKPMPFSHDIIPRVFGSFHESVKNYGKNCFMWFGPKPTALISDPELIKEVLSKSYVFQKFSTPLDKLIAQGVATYEAEKWAKHRKLINPAFHLDKLKHMLPSFYLSSCDMLNKWDEMLSRKGSCELDVWPSLQTLTADAISRTAFGSNYEEGRKIFVLQKEQAGYFLNAADLLYIPGWRFLPTKTNRRMKEIVREVESSILGIVDKRMKVIESGEANSDDLLGILLESNFQEIQQHGKDSGMSLQEVIEECRLFYLAGQETTSSLLVWTMIVLSKHLHWQIRAREEVLQVLGSSAVPDFQDLNHLKIITMIFHEVLRLYPPAVAMGRVIHHETTLGKLTLPAGTQLFLPTILLHTDSTIWGDDAMEFNPERFSEGVSKAMNGKYSYFPFGGGPRICIGQNFAMLEAKMAMAMILKHYSFELSPAYAHAPDMALSLQPQYGAHLILHKL